jgi:nicotinate-nucleotide adenylyltransferase
VRTGILGGTFDPIHVAHLHTAECALHQAQLDRVLIMPAGDPWQKSGRDLTPGEHRLQMCRLAVEGVEGIEVDLRELERDGPTYTVETLATFPADEELFLILGSDSLSGIRTWERWEEVVERVTIIEAPRPGVERDVGADLRAIQLDMGLLEISSTDIRRRIVAGEPYRYLVTSPVHGYIEVTSLYANAGWDEYGGGPEHDGEHVIEHSVELARAAADALFAKNATDIVLLDVEEAFFLSDVFVIATGSSITNVQALADHVEEKLKETYNTKPLRVEGRTQGEWVLVDFGDIIVHIFQAEPREFYSLERLWGDAPRIKWEEPVVTDGWTVRGSQGNFGQQMRSGNLASPKGL